MPGDIKTLKLHIFVGKSDKMSTGKRIRLLLPLFVLISISSLHAQNLEPTLELIIQQAPTDSLLTVLVRPALEVEISAVESDLLRRRASRAERYRRIIRALRTKSETAQGSLRAFLQSERRAGRIVKFRAYWIANLVAVTATPQAIRAIASRSGVAGVLENKTIRLQTDKKKAGPGLSSESDIPGLASNGNYFNWALERLRVRQLWQRGLTGRGILVGIIDSGVDGTHPALDEKWRGANGATATESWFDVINVMPTPYDDLIAGDLSTHGTRAMGCLLGQDGADTVGVAPDAQWIAAKAFDSNGKTGMDKIITSFEWMADPDGDLNTVDDVPDILNLSWADDASSGCLEIYWEPINNLKALGVTAIIATGNKEKSPKVGSPANKPEFFAVGSVDSLNRLSFFSAVGPSICDNKSIKPDVVAPGEQFFSTVGSANGGGYGSVRGTSFSAPLVAGIAALLKQHNPELLPDEILNALRNSATDLGDAGPDTLYGWGLVNADSALSMVNPPSRPALAIYNSTFDAGSDGLISPGEEISVTLSVINNGTSASAVSGSLSSNSPDVSVTSSQANFGNIMTGGVASNATPFVLSFSAQVPSDSIRTFNVRFTAGVFSDTVSFALNVGGVPEPPVNGVALHDIGKAGLTISNYGLIGKEGTDGGGFVYPREGLFPPDHLFHGALLLATSAEKVSDASYDETPFPSIHDLDFNYDFTVIQGGNIKVIQPGESADQEITGAFEDSKADIPLEIRVYQRSYAWGDSQNDDFVIVEYTINGPGDKNLDEIFVAQHMDWDVGGSSDKDMVGFAGDRFLAYMFDSQSSYYLGHALLTQAVSGFKDLNFSRDIQDGFTGAEKFSAMVRGAEDTVIVTLGDWSELLSGGPINLKPGRQVVVAFAILGGNNLTELRDYVLQARAKFSEIAAAKGYDITPPQISAEPYEFEEGATDGYTVHASVTDSSEIEDTRLYWRVAEQAFWSSVAAEFNTAGDSLSAVIPVQPSGTIVEYYLRAIDAQGNQGFSPANAPEQFYSFTVIMAGDGNLDGEVNIFDLIYVLKVLSGKETPSPAQATALDLDNNGKINIFDLLEMLKLLAKK
jgi:subtilisin family serine protease